MSQDQCRSWEGRCWVDSSPVHIISKGLPKVRFITYRLLAHYKTAYLNYSIHKAWDFRSKILIQELLCYDADIVCLQDVDLFQEFWYPRLMAIGYDMVFKQRTQEKEYRNEGVLIAFKRDRFQLCRTIALEFNNSNPDDSKGSTFKERCRTDDVGLITFLQPNNRKDISCMLGVATAMLSEIASNSDVRAAHMEYFVKQIELANREFQAPFLMGINLNDVPASPAYTLLRTGRVALTAQVPNACTDVSATPTCRGSALVKWLPPRMSIADSPITHYEIAWRPGGSSTLGFSLFRSVIAGDCIHYSEQTDQNGRKKIVADTVLQYTIGGLSSDMVYEFVVRAINNEGAGLWSAASSPIILPNPEKAPRLPELDQRFFSDMDGVHEIRERSAMSDSDWNIHLAMKADPLNAPTQLTPRIEGDGLINYPVTRSRMLPALDNPRIGWKSSLEGIQDPRMTSEISRDYVLGKSILRDKHGYKERNLNMLQYEVSASNAQRYSVGQTEASWTISTKKSVDFSLDSISSNNDNHSAVIVDPYSIQDQEMVQTKLLHGVEEEVSIRIITDNDFQEDASLLKQSSLLFTSSEPNPLAVPALFKKLRLLQDEVSEYSSFSFGSQSSMSETGSLPGEVDDEDDKEFLEFVNQTSPKKKRKHRRHQSNYSLPRVDVLPMSAEDRPVYKTSMDNYALAMYQPPESHQIGVDADLLAVPGLSKFAQLNITVTPMTHLAATSAKAKVLDGSSLLLDGKEILHHIGASHPRHRHALGLRSVYEVCGSTYGEPIFTAIVPKERNTVGSETLDYIFYSQSFGLVPCSHLSLPSISSVMQSFSMLSGRGETPETALIIPDWQTHAPPPNFLEDFDPQILSLYTRTYEAVHVDEEEEEEEEDPKENEEDEDDIDYGYGYIEEKRRLKQLRPKKVITPEMRRSKMDQQYSPAEVQMMKRLLKDALRKSHAIDDQTTEHRLGSTNLRASQVNSALAKGGSNKSSKRKGNNAEYFSAQYRGNNRFWGGIWQELPTENPSRNNYYLPNARFPSSHIALGADFVINDDMLPSLWK